MDLKNKLSAVLAGGVKQSHQWEFQFSDIIKRHMLHGWISSDWKQQNFNFSWHKYEQLDKITVSQGWNIRSERSRFTLGGDTSAVGGVAGSQGTHLLKQSGAGQRTQLAVRAPASAAIAATLRLGHHVPVAGGHLTQIGQHFSEAEAFSVIWRARQRDHELSD